MAVTLKSANYTFLEKIGISAMSIGVLNEKNIKIAIGFYDLKFIDAQDNVVGVCKLNENTNNLMKGVASANDLSLTQNTINKTIAEIAQGNNVTVSGSVVVDNPVTTGSSSPFKPVQSAPPPAGSKIAPALLVKSTPVPLNQATMLYQPVNGSSKGSRYFVIAMNHEIKVAAKLMGGTVSIRVEGSISPKVVDSFKKVDIVGNATGNYLSGHFECHGKVTPERIVGAVLFGSGIVFDTNIASMEVIKNLP